MHISTQMHARTVVHLSVHCVHVYVYVILIEQQNTHVQDHITDTRSFVCVCARGCVRACVCDCYLIDVKSVYGYHNHYTLSTNDGEYHEGSASLSSFLPLDNTLPIRTLDKMGCIDSHSKLSTLCYGGGG